MITCQHARHLFDSYLDGKLSASLQTELHAHRLNCMACQNELALLEACGDVIAMDRREPVLNASFTDRVVLAQRGRRMPRRRGWGRKVWLIGSPMAAAAGLALVFTLAAPEPRPLPKTVVNSKTVAVPADVQAVLASHGRPRTEVEKRELAQTPQMPAINFVESVLAPIVERSRTTLEGTRRGAEEFELLMRMGFSNTNEVLVARWRTLEQEKAAVPADATERVCSDGDPLDPSYLSQPPAAVEPAGDSDWVEQAGAL